MSSSPLLPHIVAWMATSDGAMHLPPFAVFNNDVGAECYRRGFLSFSSVFHCISFLVFLDLALAMWGQTNAYSEYEQINEGKILWHSCNTISHFLALINWDEIAQCGWHAVRIFHSWCGTALDPQEYYYCLRKSTVMYHFCWDWKIRFLLLKMYDYMLKFNVRTLHFQGGWVVPFYCFFLRGSHKAR